MFDGRLSAERLRELPREQVESALRTLTREQAEALRWDWGFWARDKQLEPPGDWDTWVITSGRGFGKTRTFVETGRTWAKSGRYRQILIGGRTADDVRSQIIEGPEGFLSLSPNDERPLYEPSKRRLVWPNGTIGLIRYGTEPRSFRGPNVGAALLDEFFHWTDPKLAWETLDFSVRDPNAYVRTLITSTPLSTEFCRKFCKGPGVVLTRGSTFENAANLSKKKLDKWRVQYEGTRIGRQELYGEILDDNPGAMWKADQLQRCRVEKHPELKRIVVAIDPAGSYGEKSDETGIVVAGLGVDGRYYVLEDLSGRYSPQDWATVAVQAFRRWRADRVVAEKNYGGAMVEHTIRTVDRDIPLRLVDAKKSKRVRAEPVSALYEQGRVSHVDGRDDTGGYHLATLETQMYSVEPGGTEHDDRIDALVYSVTELKNKSGGSMLDYAIAMGS
jgi:predicted phage terminase large subunit-like protein